jgi:hypothetical protein
MTTFGGDTSEGQRQGTVSVPRLFCERSSVASAYSCTSFIAMAGIKSCWVLETRSFFACSSAIREERSRAVLLPTATQARQTAASNRLKGTHQCVRTSISRYEGTIRWVKRHLADAVVNAEGGHSRVPQTEANFNFPGSASSQPLQSAEIFRSKYPSESRVTKRRSPSRGDGQ